MDKIVYCFWSKGLKEYLRIDNNEISFKEIFASSVTALYFSILNAKKHGFDVELVTDLSSFKHFKQLPIDKLTNDLEFLVYPDKSWLEAKMLTIKLQKDPFVFIDWNVILNDEYIVRAIKNCKQDLLVASCYKILPDIMYDNNREVVYKDLVQYSWLLEMSEHFVEEFSRIHLSAYDCRVVGFNNLKVRDLYLENFYKCLDVTNQTKTILNSDLIIEEYLLYCVAKSVKATVEVLFKTKDDQKLKEFKNTESSVSLVISDPLNRDRQKQIINTIGNNFPEYNFLINKEKEDGNKLKISLCTVVMNRKKHLLKTLRYNILVAKKFKGVIDLNILDYNSTDGLEDFLFSQDWFVEALKNDVVKYYKNYEAKYYHRTLPKNIVHFLSKGEYLMNIDADNYVTESYLTYCRSIISLEKNFYLRPSIFCSRGAFGRICINNKDFRKIGGYNLKMENWGFEDVEITLRLRKLGIEQILIPSHLCRTTIEHGDGIRIENEKTHTETLFNNHLMDSSYRNRNLVFELYPNSSVKNELELFRINFKKEKIKIDDTYTYI